MWFLRCCLQFLLLFSCLPPLFQIDVASQLSRICGFPDAVFQLPPRFLHVLSCGLKIALILTPVTITDNSDLFPRIGLPIIFTCLPFVALLFSSCLLDLSDVVPHLPPSCLVLVLQIWSFHCLQESVPDVLSRFSPSCFPLNPTMPSCLPDLVPQ